MRALLAFSRAVDGINTVFGRIADWMVLASCAISAGNAFVRYGLSMSSNAWLEVQWYLFAWSFLVAAGYTLLHREHVRIDVLNSRLPKNVQLWIEILGYVLFLTPVCVIVLWMSTPIVFERIASGEMSPNPGGLIRWPVWAALPIGFVLLLLQGWSELIKCIAFLRGQGPDPTVKALDKTAEQELADALRQQQSASQTH